MARSMKTPPTGLLDVQGLAAFLGCSEATVHRKVSLRIWPHCKPARRILFTEAHVAQILSLSERPALTSRRRSA